MNRKLALAGMAVLAVGLGGPGLAWAKGTSSHEGKPESAQMKRTKAAEQAAAQRSKAETEAVRLSSLDKEQVKAVQNKLKDLGLYKEQADGTLNAPTRAALSRYFSTQMMLLNQGRISNSSLSAFGFGQDEIQRVRGVDEQRGPERQPTRGTEQPKLKSPKEQPKQK